MMRITLGSRKKILIVQTSFKPLKKLGKRKKLVRTTTLILCISSPSLVEFIFIHEVYFPIYTYGKLSCLRLVLFITANFLMNLDFGCSILLQCFFS